MTDEAYDVPQPAPYPRVPTAAERAQITLELADNDYCDVPGMRGRGNW